MCKLKQLTEARLTQEATRSKHATNENKTGLLGVYGLVACYLFALWLNFGESSEKEEIYLKLLQFFVNRFFPLF